MKFLYLTWSGLKRKKLRTFLTLFSVVVAFVLFDMLAALNLALAGGINMADANRLIVHHRVSFVQLMPYSYMARIARVPGVSQVSHQTWFGGVYQDPKNQFATFPVEPEAFMAMNPELVLPSDQMEAWKRTRTGAVVGRKLAERFDPPWKIGDRIPLTSPIWPNKEGGAWEFDIVGIYDAATKNADLTMFAFRYDYFDEARASGEGLIGWYQVRVDDPERSTEIAAAIDEEFANSPTETKSETEGALFQGFAQQIGDIGTIVKSILVAVFFTILLVAGNTMAQSVRERTQELGVLKAIGFTNELVLGVVLGESLVITLLGGSIGLAFGWLMVSGLGQMSVIQTYFPLFYIPVPALLLGVGIAFVLGLIAGIIPAVQAMRLHLADALRREG